jgi:hypothetical protein
MKNNQEPYQYLLFIFGEFKNNDKLVELIASQLSIFKDDNSYLKYNYGDYGIVMHFQSHFSFYNLRDHVHIVLEKVVPQYYLMERPKNFYAFIPPELKLNLFDLHEENNDIEQTKVNFKDYTNIMDNFLINITSSFNEDEGIFSEENMERIFNNIMSKVEKEEKYKPTIDELLEKIKDKGLDSLTDNEKQILDEYSKS